MLGIAIPFYFMEATFFANLLALFAIIGILNLLIFHKAELWFQRVFLVWLEKIYTRSLIFALTKRRPLWFFLGTIALLFFTLDPFWHPSPQVNFFPVNAPNYINIIAEFPIGTDISETDRFMKEQLEEDVFTPD